MEKSIYKKARAKIEFSICESPCPWWHRPRKCWNHVRPKPICCRRRKRKQRGSNHLPEIWRKKFSSHFLKILIWRMCYLFTKKYIEEFILKNYIYLVFFTHMNTVWKFSHHLVEFHIVSPCCGTRFGFIIFQISGKNSDFVSGRSGSQ